VTIARATASPGRRLVRAVLALLAIVTAAVVAYIKWPAGERPRFQLPVACGETWQLGTYPGHDDFDIDMFPTRGSAWGRPVLASADGRVVRAGISGTLGERTQDNPTGKPGTGGGYWVKIDHGGKWTTSYMHLIEPPAVEVGDRVERGRQIGRVGSTGNSGAPHLHYEQRQGFEKVEAHFDGVPSEITNDDTEYTVTRESNNCTA
jgi:hypothetical protein